MAKLGTPENPEVIEPGRPTSHSFATRARTFLRLLGILAAVVAPAIVFDSAWAWLVREGSETPLAWLLALLITPAAALATLVALVGAPVLTLALTFLAFGRRLNVGHVRVGRFRLD